MTARPDLERHVTDWLHADVTSEGADRSSRPRSFASPTSDRSGGRGSQGYAHPAGSSCSGRGRGCPDGGGSRRPRIRRRTRRARRSRACGRPDLTSRSRPSCRPTRRKRCTGVLRCSMSGPRQPVRSASTTTTVLVAGASILDTVAEPVLAGIEISVEIVPRVDRRRDRASAGHSRSVNQGDDGRVHGAGGSLVRVISAPPRRPTRSPAVRPALESTVSPMASQSWLAAGTGYPAGIRPIRVAPATGELGPRSFEVHQRRRAAVGVNPYRIALLIVERFRSPAIQIRRRRSERRLWRARLHRVLHAREAPSACPAHAADDHAVAPENITEQVRRRPHARWWSDQLHEQATAGGRKTCRSVILQAGKAVARPAVTLDDMTFCMLSE